MLCTKETINKMKRQSKEWEKNWKHLSNKGLISKIYKELNSIAKKIEIEKGAKKVHRHFSEKTYNWPTDA